ncbi:MAG: malto-oligosyltrehalose synthase [Acidimicrobiales bacterium]
MTAKKAPSATYRLQLAPGRGFAAAAELAGYLSRLGVSHLYTSPYFQAAPGSEHGYDVVDPMRLSDELGGAAGHDSMIEALHEHGLGLVIDVVPNHMAITGPENRWWWDVLENGTSSVYASYFDVDWGAPGTEQPNRVLLPVLADHYGRVLAGRGLTIERQGGRFVARHDGGVVPIAPRSIDPILAAAADVLREPQERGPDTLEQLESLGSAFGHLPPSWATDRASVRERHRDKELLAARLEGLCDASPELSRALELVLDRLNETPEALDELLERQNYRLAHWKSAHKELDYRRFFDIDSLAALRVEDPQVFADAHALVAELVAEGKVQGLRIDHLDGLREPSRYLARLSELSSGAWTVVEKILEPGEKLRPEWAVAGTSGYGFARLVGGLFVDPAGLAQLGVTYRELTGEKRSFEEIAHASKHEVLREGLAADLLRLSAQFTAACNSDMRFRDYGRDELAAVLEETLASFEVYRTYVDDDGTAEPEDIAVVRAAISSATSRRPELSRDVFDLLEGVLTGTEPGEPWSDLRMRFQQLSGPVVAKGVEDTAFYVYNRLSSVNEVGGSPGDPCTSPERFHAECAASVRLWPAAMLSTSTHDTKRSEDVRARLAVLSERVEQWRELASRWVPRCCEVPGTAGTGTPVPGARGTAVDANTVYLALQTVVGAWPISVGRLEEYLLKAVREAKVHTSWTDPDQSYEESMMVLAGRLMSDQELLGDIEAMAAAVSPPGRVNALAQLVCKLTAPGVPDIYQGSELWDSSLVDPDNRRPVDFELRDRMLAEVEALDRAAALSRCAGSIDRLEEEGFAKLYVTRRLLALRAAVPAVFAERGDYRALAVGGERPGCLVAFCRGRPLAELVVIVPRLVAGAMGPSGAPGGTVQAVAQFLRGTYVDAPAGRWEDVLSGKSFEVAGGRSTAASAASAAGSGSGGARLDAAELLSELPVAILVRHGERR